MGYNRKIRFAIDSTGKQYDADELFKNKKEAAKFNEEYQCGNIDELFCCECSQSFNVSTSKGSNVHFKHKSDSEYCFLKEDKNKAEIEIHNKIWAAKESPRHHLLKNKIGEGLKQVSGVDVDSIAIDNKFIIKSDGKRRPDVYCRFHDKEIVFEIQLSQLSIKYIRGRYDFYKKHGIYLVWILDDFDIHNQGSFERQIKYLAYHQNFFKLDEESESLKFICDYKAPYIIQPDNEIRQKWYKKSVSLHDIKFNTTSYQIYYFNFSQKLDEVQIEQERLEKEQEKLNFAKRKKHIQATVNELITDIKARKENNAYDYEDIHDYIADLDDDIITEFNKKLNLRERERNNKPILNYWLTELNEKNHVGFLRFILSCDCIEVDVNRICDKEITALQEIKNSSLTYGDKTGLIRLLFERNYEMKESDINYLKSRHDDEISNEYEIFEYTCFQKLKTKYLISQLENDSKLLRVLIGIENAMSYNEIEYAKKQRVKCYNLNWTRYSHILINSYGQFWQYIEAAFELNEITNLLRKEDKKGTYFKKLEELHQNYPEQDTTIDKFVRKIYPELIEYMKKHESKYHAFSLPF